MSRMYVYGGDDARDGMCDAKLLWTIKPLDPYPEWEAMQIRDE